MESYKETVHVMSQNSAVLAQTSDLTSERLSPSTKVEAGETEELGHESFTANVDDGQLMHSRCY